MNMHLADDRRQIYYVDHLLQKWLLIALVLLESLLTAAAIWGLYRELAMTIDANLYRVHFSEDDNALYPFFIEGTKILIGTGIVNFAAIVAADRIWDYYVRGILRGLDRAMLAAQRLDFVSYQAERRRHVVLDRALRWQRSESLRLRRIRHAVKHLPDTLPQSANERAAVLAHLHIISERGSRPLGE